MELPEADLLTEIEAFCARAGMSPRAFGDQALGDRGLVTNLRKGRDLRTTTKNRIKAFMADFPIPSSEESAPAGSGN